MGNASPNGIILSQRSLVRELLAELLRIRCRLGVVARCASPEECLPHLPTSSVLVCDIGGLADTDVARFIGQVESGNPRLRVVTIDDSQALHGIESIVTAVLDSVEPRSAPHDELTPLEIEVFVAVASGHSNAAIARRMRRSSKTVEKHRANAIRKLSLRSVAQLTAYAIRYGLLDTDTILARRET